MNTWMDRALSTGGAVDVNSLGARQADGTWILREPPPDGPDLVDVEHEQFVFSVGRHWTGTIRAATDGRYYGADGWECLWLR